MRTLKRLRVPAALVLLLVLSVACERPVNIVTPAGKSAYDAEKVLSAVERLHDAVMDGYRAKEVPKATASAVVFWAAEIEEFSDAAQQGWEAAVKQAWRQAKCEVPDLRQGGRFYVYASVVNEVLQETGPEVCP